MELEDLQKEIVKMVGKGEMDVGKRNLLALIVKLAEESKDKGITNTGGGNGITYDSHISKLLLATLTLATYSDIDATKALNHQINLGYEKPGEIFKV